MYPTGQTFTGPFMPIGNVKFALGGDVSNSGAAGDVAKAFETLATTLKTLKPATGHEAQWNDALINLKASYYGISGAVNGVGVI